MNLQFLNEAEEFIARYAPEKTAEEVFTELQRVVVVHKEFSNYLSVNQITIDMPKKSDAILERRRLFINWYVEHEQSKGRYLSEVVEELTTLVFASETTIYNTLYNYR